MTKKLLAGTILALGFLLLLVISITGLTVSWPATMPEQGSIGTALWNVRTTDVVFQGFIILAGVIAILLLLGPGRTGGVKP